nr:alpha carbonic anhydrase 1, chloroplastic [Ipomoea batatas]GMD46257.1 alpha carbonic anhydrase 1, chloroplastic [Ipomoea batatas]
MAKFFVFAVSAFLTIFNPFAPAASVLHGEHYHHHHGMALNFSYSGTMGPARWGALNPAFSACSNGKSQSPINILRHKAVINKKLKPLEMKYSRSVNATLMDNGFNVGISYGEDAGALVLEGKIYRLKQMHWHAPSEHQIDGFHFAAELHLVHIAPDNSVAVLAVLLKLGHPDPLLAKIQKQLTELPRELLRQEKPRISLGNLNTHELVKFSHSHKYYRYVGSLTTPPCTEDIIWTVIGKIHSVSREQVVALRAPLDSTCKRNSRPIQPLDGRHVELYER